MSQELNATCDICGKRYHICNSCKEIKSFSPWRTVTDTYSHYLIFLALSEYTKTKDKNKARECLSKCDLVDLDTFNENIKSAIKEIMEDGQKKVDINITKNTHIKKNTKNNENGKMTNNDIE